MGKSRDSEVPPGLPVGPLFSVSHPPLLGNCVGDNRGGGVKKEEFFNHKGDFRLWELEH